MKKLTGTLGILLVFTLALTCFAGCGSAKEEEVAAEPVKELPVMATVDTSALTLGTAEKGNLRIAFDSDMWLFWEEMNNLGIALTETWEADYAVNVQCLDNGEPGVDELTEEHLAMIMEGLGEAGDWIEIPVSELRKLDGETVAYMECVTSYTEGFLTYLVESGAYEQSFVDEYGEQLLAMPATRQIQVYSLVDGHLISTVGTYYDEAHTQTVIDAVTVAVQTIEII